MKIDYSFGITSKNFWFLEFQKYLSYINEGFSEEEIKKIQKEENIFQAPSQDYGVKIVNEVERRYKALPKDIIDMFESLSLDDQKLVNLIGFMLVDRLFFEYMNEVYREKLITGYKYIDNTDFISFINKKSNYSDKIKNIRSTTERKISTTYLKFLRESNLIYGQETEEVTAPIMDFKLKSVLREDLYPIYRIFIGE